MTAVLAPAAVGHSARARGDGPGVLERMLDMMSIIPRAPHWISTTQVHERLASLGYEVDRRTVVRDLNKLAERFGFERRGDSERDGKRTALAYAWRWPANSPGIGAPVLTETEALALVMVRAHLDDLLPPMVTEALAPQFLRAERKLQNTPGAGLRHWQQSVRVVAPTQPLARPAVKHAVRDAIYLALAAQAPFTGCYRSRGGDDAREMLFHPQGLVLRGQVIYLVANTWDYDDVRLYPLHRFERAQRGEGRRRVPPGFSLDAWLAAQNGLGFATGGGDITLQLRFRRGAGQHLLETPLAADQRVHDAGDGTLEVRATVPETTQLAWWLLGFGDHVEVLAPATLREQMQATAERMAAAYRAPAAGIHAADTAG